MNKIAIIGGGAAGMMAAATIAERNLPESEIMLFERNTKLGAKVMISGGGRCNVTTGFSDLKQILTNYPRGARFLRTAMYAFSPQELWSWLEARGVELKTEADMRVFPKSDNGKDIMALFERILFKHNVDIRYKSIVSSISKLADGFKVQLQSGEEFLVDQVIITTGGQAYRHTGSEGDGYKFAEDLGHKITALAPSLNSYMAKEDFFEKIAGISFAKVRLRFVGADNYEFTGPMIFTHKGVSGPAVFALSALAAFEPVSSESPVKLMIDFLPELNQEVLREQLIAFKDSDPKKLLQNSLAKFVPKRLASLMVSLLKMNPEKTNAEVSNKEFHQLVEQLKNFSITLIKKTPGDEFVTAGGVDLAEVNSKTMESKICPGLFFAGEILDIDGFTGGFNLQVAWATGRLAGVSC